MSIANVYSLREARQALHVSVSQLKTFTLCARRFEHQYVLRTHPSHRAGALAFGSAIHAALAAFYQQLKDEREPMPTLELLQHFDTEWQAQLAAGDVLFGDKEDADTLRTTAHGMLTTFTEEGLRPNEILGIEVPFALELPGREEQLVGAFDLVAKDDDGAVLIIEHKTAARRWSQDQLRYDIQAAAYTWAAAELGLGQVEVCYQLLLKTKTPAVENYRVQRGPADMDDLQATITGILRAVDAHAFWPTRGWQCAGCQFAYACTTPAE